MSNEGNIFPSEFYDFLIMWKQQYMQLFEC